MITGCTQNQQLSSTYLQYTNNQALMGNNELPRHNEIVCKPSFNFPVQPFNELSIEQQPKSKLFNQALHYRNKGFGLLPSYERQNEAKKFIVKSIVLMKQAAEQGDASAQLYLVDYYFDYFHLGWNKLVQRIENKKFNDIDLKIKGLIWLEKLAKQGYYEAKLVLRNLLVFRLNELHVAAKKAANNGKYFPFKDLFAISPSDQEKRFKLLKKHGYSTANFDLIRVMVSKADTAEHEVKRILPLAYRLARQGDPIAQFFIGISRHIVASNNPALSQEFIFWLAKSSAYKHIIKWALMVFHFEKQDARIFLFEPIFFSTIFIPIFFSDFRPGFRVKDLPFTLSSRNFSKAKDITLEAYNVLELIFRLYSAGKYMDAIPHTQRLLHLTEVRHGKKHKFVTSPATFLAMLYVSQGQYSKAEPLLQRAISIYEDYAKGRYYSKTLLLFKLSKLFNSLGDVYMLQKKFAQATVAYQRALTLIRETIPASKSVTNESNIMRNILVAPQFYNLAWNAQSMNKQKQALTYIRKSTNAYKPFVHLMDRLMFDSFGSREDFANILQDYTKNAFKRHLEIASIYTSDHSEVENDIVAETFVSGQILRNNAVGNVIGQMMAKVSIGDNDLARLLRERDRIWQKLKKSQQSDLTQFAEINAYITNRYPKFSELAIPKPVDLYQLQQLLRPDEALVFYDVGDRYSLHYASSNMLTSMSTCSVFLDNQRSFVWLITKTSASFRAINLSRQQIDSQVQILRAALDPEKNRELFQPYPVQTAYTLYKNILEPECTQLKTIKTLFIVPDGALESLPFNVLVTELYPTNITVDYQNVAWLSRKWATVTLPTVSSLYALRTLAAKSKQAPQPFIGFGDPKFEGSPGANRGVGGISLIGDINSGIIPANKLSTILGRLPDTATELRTNARILGAGPNSVFLQEHASIPQLWRVKLEDYRVVQFATHALVAGQIKEFQLGQAEPAIALTPPLKPTKDNDGLLRASQIAAKLKLNADWVVLSACNTAAPDGTPGAVGLSGLAKAFFYAGTKAMLVSHWSVVSKPTVDLTTHMFQQWQQNPSIGRAEALRRAQMYVLDNPKRPYYKHPGAWAPFVVAGEGGMGR